MSIKIHTRESDLRHLFKTNGYVAVQEAINLKQLQKVQDDMKKIVKLNPFKIGAETDFDTGIKSMNQKDLHLFQIAASQLWSLYSLTDPLMNLIRIIVGDEKVLFHVGQGFVLGLPNDQRLAYNWHQDGTHHPNSLEHIHVWFPIFRGVNIKNGAMSFLEDSHKQGLLNYEKHKALSDGYTTNLVSGLEEVVKTHSEIYCEINLGDCLFFNDEMIHKSNINQTNLCRVAGVMKVSLDPRFEVHAGLVGV